MAKLVKCKTCGTQIAKSAKVCPHCGAKRKKHHFIRNFFILLLLIVIGLGSQMKKIPEVSYAIGEIQSALGNSSSTSTSTYTSKPTATVKQETASKPTAQAETPAAPESDGVTKELKDFLDSYEAFMNEYCEFAENYNADDLTMSLKLLDILAKEVDFAEKADAYKETTMTAADEAYYIEAMLRIERRLLEASAKIQ